MFPIRDENPTRRRPWVTLALIGACVYVFFGVQPISGSPEELRFTFERAAIPCELREGRPLSSTEVDRTLAAGDETACVDDPESRPVFPQKSPWLAVLYSMFLHGGLLHLGGNMLFLWIFGNNVEDRLGHGGYAAFYLLGGLAATVAHYLVQPASTVPIVGASGAIAAVMGAYLVLYPHARITTVFFFIFIMIREVPAWLLLGLWFGSQFLIDASSGVAWMAHVGGFVFGVAGGIALRAMRPPPPRRRLAPSGIFDD